MHTNVGKKKKCIQTLNQRRRTQMWGKKKCTQTLNQRRRTQMWGKKEMYTNIKFDE